MAGTAVNVQAMAFGNVGEGSGTGVAFTRDPGTGARGSMATCRMPRGEDGGWNPEHAAAVSPRQDPTSCTSNCSTS